MNEILKLLCVAMVMRVVKSAVAVDTAVTMDISDTSRRLVNVDGRMEYDVINSVIYGDQPIADLDHFWESTGLCPPEPHNRSHDYFLSKDMEQNLAFIGSVPNKGIKWVRIHWLLDLITVNRSNSVSPVYNFTYLDQLMDLVHQNGLYAGFEIMGNPSGYFTDFENRTQVLEWRDLVRTIAQRYIDKYGLDYVSQWRFESWNEPDHHDFDSLNITIQGFLNYYDASAEGLRLASHRLIFGGPAASCRKPSYSKICWALLQHIAQGKNYFGGAPKMDYISFHVKGGRDISGNSTFLLLTELNTTHRIWAAHPQLKHVPIVNDEGDPVVGWAKPLTWRADATYAAIVAKIIAQHQYLFKLKKHLPVYSLLSNDNGFLTWSPHYFTQRTLLARFQMNNTQPHHVQFIRKPVYDVMGLLSLLGQKQVYHRIDLADKLISPFNVLASSTMTGDSGGTNNSNEFTIMLYNSDDTELTWGKDIYKLRFQLPTAMEHESAEVYYSQYSIDNSVCNPYLWWETLDKPDTPTPQQLTMMRLAQCPHRSMGPVPLGRGRNFRGVLSKPGVTVYHLCAKPRSAPSQVSSVRIIKITQAQIVIVWNGANQSSFRCIKTYEVEYSTEKSGHYSRINIERDDVTTLYVYAPLPSVSRSNSTSVSGYYRVRTVDYWSRPGPYSEPVYYHDNQ